MHKRRNRRQKNKKKYFVDCHQKCCIEYFASLFQGARFFCCKADRRFKVATGMSRRYRTTVSIINLLRKENTHANDS